MTILQFILLILAIIATLYQIHKVAWITWAATQDTFLRIMPAMWATLFCTVLVQVGFVAVMRGGIR